jgi:beta-lactam-binding protein with PASTA domain
MPEDFIDAGMTEETEAPMTEEVEGTEEEESSDAENALIPKSILAGQDIKPGQEITLKVVHVYEDEVEVQYSKGDSEAAEEGMPEMKSAEAALEGMASTGGGY